MAGAVNRGRGLCFEESATGAFFFDRLYFASAKRVFLASATFDVTAPLLAIHLRRESRQVTALCVLKTPLPLPHIDVKRRVKLATAR